MIGGGGGGLAGAYRAFAAYTVVTLCCQCRWEWPCFPRNCLELPVKIHQLFTDFHFPRTPGSTMLPVSLEAWEALQPYHSKH